MEQSSFTIQIEKDELETLLHKLEELNKINTEHRISWSDNYVTIYTLNGTSSEKVNVLKTFVHKRNQVFKNIPDGKNLSWTILDGKNFVKQHKFLFEEDEQVFDMTFSYTDRDVVLSTTCKNSVIELPAISAEETELKDLTIEVLKSKLNYEDSNWYINLDIKVLDKLKKLSKLQKISESANLELELKDNNAYFSENKFKNFHVGKSEVESTDSDHIFNKKYLEYIVPKSDKIKFCVFDSYILVCEVGSYLIFNLELSS